MKDQIARFRSEAELVRKGRQLVRKAIQQLETKVTTRYEVPAPGVVPDLVIFNKEGHVVHYVITVEFKLGDWRRALNQAFRHHNFGNEAYVVLDETRSASALRHLEDFTKANVGLVTLNTNDEVKVWHYPQPALPFSSQFSQVVAGELLAPHRSLSTNLPFIRSTRGGLTLAGLKTMWGFPHSVSEVFNDQHLNIST